MAHGGVLGGIGEDGGDGRGESIVGHDAAGFAVADNRLRAAVGSDDGGHAARKSLKHDVAEGFGVRGEDEEVHVGVGRVKRLALAARQ